MVLERGSQGAEPVVEKRSLSTPMRQPAGIRRDAILHRLNAARPRLVMAIAPAGYGKSTVLRQYAAEFDASAICNCLDVGTQVEFAQEVAKALADGDPPRTAALAQQHLAGSGNAGWEAFAMDSWSKASAHDLFVFENVECILDSIDNVAFLSRLLARTPGERSLAIGSRRALPFSWHRFFAPHQVLALHADELRFEAPEIGQAFTGLDISSDSLTRVAEITRGWPIAVFLLARLAREGSLVAHFERLGGIDFEGLYDYLSDQVLAMMPPKRFARLLAVAAIPRATGAEVAKALDDPEAHDDLVEFARTSPFLYPIGDDTYEAHPLVRAMLAERYPERWREWLLKAADALAPTHPDRAALLYLAGGNQDAAADSLEAMLDAMASDLTPAAAEVIGRLETEVLLRHPSAWPASMTVRSANITLRQWLNEATVAHERITPATPVPVRLGILTSFVDVLTNLGRHAEALEAIKEFDRPDVPPQNRIIGRLYESGIAARQGRFGRAMEIWAGIEPLLAEAKYALSRGIEEIPVRAARFAGDRETERTLLERSIAMTRESQSAVGIALVLEEATFAAWLAGEDELYERYARELEAAIVPNTTQGTEAFRACTRGNFEPLRRDDGYERPKIRSYAALIGCTYAEGEVRAELASTALAAADSAGEPMTAAIACIACAECHAGRREEFIARARDNAAKVDSDELRAAIEGYAAGESTCGILTPLVRRFREVQPDALRSGTACCVSLGRECVECAGEKVKLSHRELELMMYLAARHRACRVEEIADALWPNSEGSDYGALRVYVSRVRAKLGESAIVAVTGGYCLGDDVLVDLDGIERALLRARQQHPIRSELRSELALDLNSLLSAPPDGSKAADWLSPVHIRIDDLTREIATLLGRDALDGDKVEEALALGQRILDRDACDEPARELRIRALLHRGDLASARREFRVYREVLASELGAKPSAALAALVTTAP